MNPSQTKTDAAPQDVQRELAALERMTTTELCHRYEQLHGQPTRTRHRQYLIRKIAWRIQANAEGDLSERARRRAEELANDADVRVMPPRTHATNAAQATVEQTVRLAFNADPRLPAPGTAITRTYKGRTIRVLVSPDGSGFEHEGERYKTLSAVAKAITGSHVNGFRFFRLEGA